MHSIIDPLHMGYVLLRPVFDYMFSPLTHIYHQPMYIHTIYRSPAVTITLLLYLLLVISIRLAPRRMVN